MCVNSTFIRSIKLVYVSAVVIHVHFLDDAKCMSVIFDFGFTFYLFFIFIKRQLPLDSEHFKWSKMQ